jgi:hypothetical protein
MSDAKRLKDIEARLLALETAIAILKSKVSQIFDWLEEIEEN